MIHEWAAEALVSISFSPDSSTLVVARTYEFSFWNVETLQPIRRLLRDHAYYSSRVAFSPDGKLIALEVTPGVIHLEEAATGRTIAKLTDPFGDRSTWMSFTPDGSQLVSSSFEAKALHIWDLRRIRTRLKAMGLDWDWPEFSPARVHRQ